MQMGQTLSERKARAKKDLVNFFLSLLAGYIKLSTPFLFNAIVK